MKNIEKRWWVVSATTGLGGPVYYLANAERRVLANYWLHTVFGLFLLLYGVLAILFVFAMAYLTFLGSIGKAQGQQLAIVPRASGSRPKADR